MSIETVLFKKKIEKKIISVSKTKHKKTATAEMSMQTMDGKYCLMRQDRTKSVTSCNLATPTVTSFTPSIHLHLPRDAWLLLSFLFHPLTPYPG